MRFATRCLLPMLALLALLLGSCSTDVPVPSSTIAWLNDTDGMQLTFRNTATGATETVWVQRSQASFSSRGGKLSVRSNTHYTGIISYFIEPGKQNGLILRYTDYLVLLKLQPQPLDTEVQLTTADAEIDESVTASADATARLHDNLVLDNHAFGRAVEFGLRAASPTAEGLQHAWYSKATGLVAYRKNDGQLWLRQ